MVASVVLVASCVESLLSYGKHCSSRGTLGAVGRVLDLVRTLANTTAGVGGAIFAMSEMYVHPADITYARACACACCRYLRLWQC